MYIGSSFEQLLLMGHSQLIVDVEHTLCTCVMRSLFEGYMLCDEVDCLQLKSEGPP